jgi:hypothetical protein
MRARIERSLLASILSLLACMSPALAVEEELASPEEVHGSVALTYNASADGTITGLLKNNGTTIAQDVRLLVHHAWLWSDEKHPGPPSENPARSAYYVVDGQIPPGGELRFRYTPNPTLPQRTDGRFRTTAEIVGITEATIPK